MKHKSNKEQEREITCPSGKIGYKSKRAAERAIRCIQTNCRSERFRAYYCKECGEFHLTSCHLTGPQIIKKSFAQYNRLEKKYQDTAIYKEYGLA